MSTRMTFLAALLFAGASQAALAQDQDRDHSAPGGAERPRFQEHRGGDGGEGRWSGGPRTIPAQAAQPAAPAASAPSGADRPRFQEHRGGGEGRWSGGPRTIPAQADQPAASAPSAPMGGHARFGAPPPAQGPVAQPQAQPQPQPGPRFGRDGGERRWEGRGDHNGFAPGGTANGDRHWDRNEAPREVVPPAGNAERGWDRQHDGHAPDPRRLEGRNDGRWDGRNDRHWDDRNDGHWDGRGDGHWDGRRDGTWDRDHRGPPANWQHWERNRFPPIYSSSHRFHVGGYHRPYGWFVRSWAFGDFLPHGWYGTDYWIDDFYDYDLPYPPPGMHWVRVGDDALLVDDYSGRIVQVVREIFW